MPPCFCWRIHHTCSWSRGQNHVRTFWFTCCPCNAHVYFSRHLNLFSGSCARFITLSHNESWFWLVRACPPGTQTWHAGKVPAMTRSPGSGCCWSRARKTDPGTRPVIQKSTGVEGNSTNSDRMWQACEKTSKNSFIARHLEDAAIVSHWRWFLTRFRLSFQGTRESSHRSLGAQLEWAQWLFERLIGVSSLNPGKSKMAGMV